MPKNMVWAKLTMPVYPSSRSKLATSTTNTSTLAATLSALTPGNRKGVKARASSSPISSTASTRLRGRSLEISRFSRNMGGASSAVGHRVDALGAPQQHRHHQSDVGEQGQLGQQKAGVVGHQPHQQGPDQRAAGGAQAADDDHDEDQHVHLGAHL